MVIDGITDDDHVLFVIKRVSPEIVSVRQQSNSNGFTNFYLYSVLCYDDDDTDDCHDD